MCVYIYSIYTYVLVVQYLVELRLICLLTVSGHILQEQGLDGRSQSQHGFGTGDQVKGHGERPSLLKVGEPEFGPSELPLDIGVILKKRGKQIGWRGKRKNSLSAPTELLDFDTQWQSNAPDL